MIHRRPSVPALWTVCSLRYHAPADHLAAQGIMSPPSDSRSRNSGVAAVIVVALLLYFVPFVLIVLDELVFETYWLSGRLPDWCQHVLAIIYMPLIWLVQWLVH